jgi:hypothetical protein
LSLRTGWIQRRLIKACYVSSSAPLRFGIDKSLTLEEIAKSERMVPSYATRLFRLTLLTPDIVSGIRSGSSRLN